jgi:hypothetical protein
MAVNEKEKGWLVHTSVTDGNFRSSVERANAETIMAALEEITGQPGHKVREKALRAQLAKLSKAAHDQASEAATEVVEMEQRREANVVNEQAERERRIAECHQVIGRIQGVKMVSDFGNVAGLVWLREVRETKLYRDLPGVGTWEKFCESVGISRRKVEEDLLNLETFGEEFLGNVAGFRVGYRDLRRLRQLTHEGALQIEDGVLVVGDEEIPLDPDHREDLQAAMERLLDAKDAVIREKDATQRANEKLLQAKQDLIRKQEKEIARYEGAAEAKGLTAAEDAFIQQCSNARTTIDGFLLKFDPDRNPLPEDATPRMKAALMETLGYFRRAIVAAHDTAGDLYGVAEMDSAGWVPPNLREGREED